jgi:hypothetical protein
VQDPEASQHVNTAGKKEIVASVARVEVWGTGLLVEPVRAKYPKRLPVWGSAIADAVNVTLPPP